MKAKKWNLETIAERKEVLKQALDELETIPGDEWAKLLHWKKLVGELDVLTDMEERLQETQKYARAEYIKAFERGKLEGEIKAEVSKIKALIEWNIPQEKITSNLKFLTQDKVKDRLETNLAYIKDHLSDSDSDICEQLGVVEELSSNFQ